LTTSPAPSEVQLSRNAGKIAGAALAVALIATVVILFRGESAPPVSETKPAAPAAAPTQPAAAAVAEVPAAPLFELASGLTAVRERADNASVLADFAAALERDPQDAATLYGMGRVLLRLKRPNDAVGPLQRAFALKDDDWSYAFSAGYALGLASRFPEAVTALRAARALNPSDPVTSYDLALALQRQGNYAAAAEEFAAAIGLNSAAIPPRLGRAISLDRLGNSTQAIAAYEDCLQMMPAGPDADRVRARVAQLRGG
jgi:Flp pilus assembly protein TadD